MSRTVRLHCPGLRIGQLTLDGPEFHHARDVMRVSAGDSVDVFDGAGRCGPATVIEMGRSCMTLAITAINVQQASRRHIVLATAIPKQSVQQDIVSHCTQLGIDRFVPIICRRSTVRQINVDRWLRWAIEACKQSSRNHLPEVSQAETLSQALARAEDFTLRIYGTTEQAQPPSWAASQWSSAIIYVGPEGGFDTEELLLMRRHSVSPVRIGQFSLRTETAGVALSSAVIFAS